MIKKKDNINENQSKDVHNSGEYNTSDMPDQYTYINGNTFSGKLVKYSDIGGIAIVEGDYCNW